MTTSHNTAVHSATFLAILGAQRLHDRDHNAQRAAAQDIDSAYAELFSFHREKLRPTLNVVHLLKELMQTQAEKSFAIDLDELVAACGCSHVARFATAIAGFGRHDENIVTTGPHPANCVRLDVTGIVGTLQ